MKRGSIAIRLLPSFFLFLLVLDSLGLHPNEARAASDTMIKAPVPNMAGGTHAITVTKGSSVSNAFDYQVLGGDQVQVINVTWEGGANRTFVAPSQSTGSLDTPIYIWQP